MRSILSFAFAVLAVFAFEARADACGCFAQPSPVQQVVQAGERIVFAVRDDEVEMHVQVNYEGDAEDFGWLLPVPAIPELAPGSDLLFAQLDAELAPRFFFNEDFSNDCGFADDGGGLGCSDDDAAFNGSNGSGFGSNGSSPSVVVSRETVGAFDAAVLRADDGTAMFDWLSENRFVVPVGPEDDVVARYLGPDRYFLALKLDTNRRVGDLQPIVLTFPGTAAMIPITLTQVGATPDMPVLVHVFGHARAIPRNYAQTELNDEHINWFGLGENYVEVVTRAVDEAEGAHSFVTEAAEAPVLNLSADIEYDLAGIRTTETLGELFGFIDVGRYGQSPKLQNLVRAVVDYPASAEAEGISEERFFGDLAWFAQRGQFTDLALDGAALAAAMEDEIVEPARRAQALAEDFSVVTRLFTTLSPEEMTVDPVFDFNDELPLIDNDRVATFQRVCNTDSGEGFSDRGWLTVPDGRRFFTSALDWRDRRTATPAPVSRRIQALYAEGAPVTLVDNTASLTPSDPPSAEVVDGSGCRGSRVPSLAPLLVVGLWAFWRRRQAILRSR